MVNDCNPDSEYSKNLTDWSLARDPPLVISS